MVRTFAGCARTTTANEGYSTPVDAITMLGKVRPMIPSVVPKSHVIVITCPKVARRMPILNWLTCDREIGAAKGVPYRLLEEAPELSAGDPGAGNMQIQGDNLEVLKALLSFYSGQVKCIYIDPPHAAWVVFASVLNGSIWALN
jgi:hypothetical protein